VHYVVSFVTYGISAVKANIFQSSISQTVVKSLLFWDTVKCEGMS